MYKVNQHRFCCVLSLLLSTCALLELGDYFHGFHGVVIRGRCVYMVGRVAWACSRQCCLFIHCWPVVMHLFVSNPGLPELTAVIWAACVLYLCTVQVPCYDVGRSLPYISKPGGCWQTGGGLLLTYCCACCVCVLFHIIPCVLRSFFAWPGAIFLRAGALQASLLMSCCIHTYMSTSYHRHEQ
jgi:hypothetical protein